jgi:hypothetical protein
MTAIEASNVLPSKHRMVQLAFGNAVESMLTWKNKASDIRRQLLLEIQGHLLVHANFMETFEFFKREFQL